MERREAQRPTSLAARTPETASPRQRGYCRERLAGRKACPAGLVSLLPMGGDPPWRLPALHPLTGRRKKGNDVPDVAKQPAGGALAQEPELKRGWRVESVAARMNCRDQSTKYRP